MTPPTWTTACPDWEQRIVEGRSLVPCPPLFPEEADAALAIFRDLRVVDVAGAPTMGECCRPWVFEFVAAIFGAYDAETGRRLIRYFMLLISKKNAKSTIAAGIMLTALLRNWRQSAEFMILAPTVEIAGNSFKPAADMIRADETLIDLIHIQDSLRLLTHKETGATLKVVAADSQTVAGKKATGVLIDELWLFGMRADAENMIREATGGLASRPEGFVISLSTQSDAQPAGIFDRELRAFRAVRDGARSDPRRLGVLYEFPQRFIDDGSFKHPDNWRITNPNLGASVDPEFIADKLAEAEGAGAASLTGFYAKHLNVEIGLNLRSDRWAGADFWQAGAEAGLTLDGLIDRCDVAVVGIDGGGLDDLLGLGVMGRERGTRRWLLWSHAWAHRIVLERRKEIAPRLLDFERAGELTIIDDESDDDVQGVADIIERIRGAGILAAEHAIGVDPVGINDIVDELERREFSLTTDEAVGQITAVKQGWTLSNAIKVAERRLAAKTMLHAGAAMMAWCVGNLKIEARGNAITATKQSAGSAKIDPAMAMFNAVNLMALNPEGAGASVFDRLGAAEAAHRAANPAPTLDEEAAILRDPRHPRWHEMLARYNRRLELADTDAEF
ncbi:MAG: terminase large subunit [Alphaproteobacteria bacterium]